MKNVYLPNVVKTKIQRENKKTSEKKLSIQTSECLQIVLFVHLYEENFNGHVSIFLH